MFPITIEHAPKQFEISDLRLPRDEYYALLWYGANIKPYTRGKVPRVIIFFKQLRKGILQEGWTKISAPVTDLGQMRIGSIWRNGLSTHQIVFETHHYSGFYTETQWEQITSVKEVGSNLIPPADYPLHYPYTDHSPLLQFRAQGKTLLVPCLEFFTRCYAHSSETNRILMTYNQEEISNRLMLHESIKTVPGVKSVWVPPGVAIADARLLAQLRYDKVAWRRVCSIHAALDQQLYEKKRDLAYIPIGPWHYGPAQLKVEGVRLSTSDFLGLRIIGHTLPEDGIHALYEQRDQATEGENGRHQLPQREIKEIPEGQTIAVTGAQMADRDTDMYLLKDPDIEILNTPPKITKEAITKDRGRAESKTPSAPSDVAAPGETGGTGKRTAGLRTLSDAMLTSHGSVRDLWNGLLDVQNANAGIIKSLCWYHSEHKFSRTDIQAYIELPPPPLDKNDAKSKDIRTWLKKSSLPSSRGVCVIKIVTPSITGYIIEILRATKIEADGNLLNSEGKLSELENFCGLAVIPPNGIDFESWLKEALEAISRELGIMSKVLCRIQFTLGEDYKRVTKHNNKATGQATAMNALRKLGIQGLIYPEDKPAP
ncbi:MAG: hypothetical protein QM740_06245 [Acidovorax sp.]